MIFFKLALRNLIQARRKTLLIGSALATVSLLLVILLGLTQGMSENMLRSATTHVTGHVNIAGFHKTRPQDSAPMITDSPKLRKTLEDIVRDRATIVDRGRGWGKIISETSSFQAVLTAIDIESESNLKKRVPLAPQNIYKENGTDKILGDMSRLSNPNTVLLFASQAKRLGVDVGDIVTITMETVRGQRNTVDAEIVAIAREMGAFSSWNIFIPKTLYRNLYKLTDTSTGAFYLYLDDIHEAANVRAELQTKLEEAGYRVMEYSPKPFFRKFEIVGGEDWTGQKLDLTIWEDEITYMAWANKALDGLSFTLIGILLIIIIVGIINTTFMAVRERIREIGTVRAMGMQRHQVLTLFLIESMVMGSVSSLAGSLLASLLALVVNSAHIPLPSEALQAVLMNDTLFISVHPTQILQTVVLFTLLTTVGAIWPSFRAATLEPVRALQHTR